ncbi:MAG: DUF2490 domain-containing protein, partial [Bacteroidota bacterium]
IKKIASPFFIDRISSRVTPTKGLNRMKRSIGAGAIILLVSLIIPATAMGQKVNQFNSWWYYSGTYTINEKWTSNLLYSWSRHDFIRDWQISKLGLSANRSLSKNFGIGVSYEWAIIFPYGELPIPEKWKEHRILERVFFQEKIGKVRIRAVFELEQFFRNRDFLNCSRVLLAMRFPLIVNEKGQESLGMSFFEQIFIRIGKGPPFLAQNRYYGGFDIRLSNSLNLALGYLNQRIIITPALIENDHTLMVGLFHKADISKLFNKQ